MGQLTKSDIEYALLAGRAYQDSRTDVNRIAKPAGWSQLTPEEGLGHTRSLTSGFEAVAFRNDATGEIVISFAGTDFTEKPDLIADGVLGLGLVNQQLIDAAIFFKKVQQAYGDNITFTGHSLGGGLAAVMGVFFDRPAVTFDPAPFRLLATEANSQIIAAALRVAGFGDDAALNSYSTTEQNVATALPDVAAVFAALSGLGGQFTTAAGLTYLASKNYPTVIDRIGRVKGIALNGEILTSLIGNTPIERSALERLKILGSPQNTLPNAGMGSIKATETHSMALLIAVAVEPRFGSVPAQLPNLHKLFIDPAVYGRDTKTSTEPNFLEALVQKEFGPTAVNSSGEGSGYLAKFADDLDKLIGDVGTVQTNLQLRDALVVAAMDHYYLTPNPLSASPLFVVSGGGLSFDLSAFSDGALKSPARLAEAARGLLDPNEANYALGLRSGLAWTIQQGANALVASGTGSDEAMVGGATDDSLSGGGGADILIGAAGVDTLNGGDSYDTLFGGADDDTLVGGAGSDYLLGGSGADRYEFAAGHGSDIVVDADGAGSLWFEGQQISGGKKVDDAYWISDDGRFGFTLVPNGSGGQDLIVSRGTSLDKITIRNWQPGQLGILLYETSAAMPQTPSTIVGVAGEGTRGDQILATSANDRVIGTSVHDVVVGEAGDDLIEAGAGGDVVLGGFGSDRIFGGDGNDAIRGGGYRADSSYFNTMTEGFGTGWANALWQTSSNLDSAPAVVYIGPDGQFLQYVGIAFSTITAPSGTIDQDNGDVIDGGMGDDLVYGDGGDDRIHLGDGNDRGFGGQDSDVVFGDAGDDELHGDYLLGGQPLQYDGEHGADVLDGGTGNDILYGYGGDDSLYGGDGTDRLLGDEHPSLVVAEVHGRDYLDGGAGNDELIGHGGADDLFGGDDNDILIGDLVATQLAGQFHGSDYLNGEGGDDELQGHGSSDELFGGDGNDTLFGDDLTTRLAGQYHGDDYLDGEAGDDYLDGQGGDDTLFGGDGVDLLWGDGSGQDVAVAVHGNDYLHGGAAIDFLRGGGGADTLFGGTEDDVLIGDDLESVVAASAHGSDTLDGEEGNDKLWGNGGTDTLFGGDGDDTLMGDSIQSQLAAAAHGDDFLDGGAGADVLVGGGGNDTLLGGAGDDRMNGDDSGDNLDISANGNDYMDGGAGNDVLIGAGGADTLLGGDGNDALHGGDGADVLDGGSGADYLAGGQGDDLYFAGAGDLVRDTEGASHIVLDANFDASNLQVAVDSNSPEHSVLTITSGGQSVRIDAVLTGPAMTFEFADGSVLSLEQLLQRAAGINYSAGDGADRVLGTGGADELRGLSGDDLLFGQDGDDRLLGGNGADVIEGGAGNDVLNGGSGNDRLIGGTGADRYTLDLGAGYDEIVDDGGELSFGGSVRTSDVRLVTQGDDLRVDLSPRDQITIRGYAQSAANWSVRFSDGTAVALSALPTVPSPSLPTDAVAAKAAFIDDLRRWWYAEQLKAGMEPRGDGTLSAVSVSESLYGKETTYLSSAFSVNSRTVNQPVLASLEMSTSTTSQVLSSQSEPRLVPVPVVVYSQPSLEPIYGPNRNPLTGQPEIIGYHYFPSQTIVEYQLQTINYVTTVRQTDTTYNVDDLTTGPEDNLIEIRGGALISAGSGDDQIVVSDENSYGYARWAQDDKPFFLDGGSGNDLISGEAGDDWLIGGAGDDLLRGGLGSDRYLRFGGDGSDVIVDLDRLPLSGRLTSEGTEWGPQTEAELQAELAAAPQDTDVLVLPQGVTAADLTFEWSTRTVRATVGDAELRQGAYFNQLTNQPEFDVEAPVLVIRWGSGEAVAIAMPTPNMPRGFGIERVELVDGTVLSRDDLFALAPPPDLNTIGRENVLNNVTRGYGGGGNDQINGTAADDLLLGGEGADTLRGGDGNDALIGGKGADLLEGGAGNDGLGGGPVDRYSAGNTYVGGAGNDVLAGTRDADSYLFDLGDGHDFVWHTFAFPDAMLMESGAWWSDTGESPAFWNYALNELPPELRAELTQVDEYGNPIPPSSVPIAGLDTLRFGAGIAPQDVQMSRQGDSLVIAHVNGQDSVTFADWFAHDRRWDPNLGEWVDLGQRPQVLGRIEFADGTTWRVLPTGEIEVAVDTVTLDGTDGADAIYATDGTPTIINGGAGNDLLVGADQADTINAGADDDTVYGNAGNDVLDGGDGDDTVYGWDGDDTLQGGNGVDHLYGDAGNDVVDGGAGDDTLFGWTGDDQLRGGEGNDVIGGDDGNDLVDGGAGSDALFGWTGTDVVQGGAGWDYVDGGGDNDALTGGTEGDTLIGGGGGDFLAGGSGNDGLRPGAGADIVAFNRGDGADTVYAPTVGEGAGERNDTLSLGGIRYSELRLAREGDDLLLKVAGATDAVRFEGWYVDPNNDAVSTLQLIVDSTADYDAASGDPLVNRRIARLNFQTLVGAFDTAYNANFSIGDWAIPSATLNTALVASSDADAIGGQLAYRYGRDGNLAGLDFATASAVLADANFGTAAQSIGSGPTSGGVRLMRVSATAPETGELDARVSTGTPLLSRTAPLADDAAAAGKLTPVQGVASDAERVGLPRLLGRWLGEVANADSGFWLKRPFGAKLVAANTQPAPAIAICELAQLEADARVAGAPHRATGGTLDGSTPSLPAATDHTAPRLASKLRPLTAAMVDAAISGAARWGATGGSRSINAGPVERTAIADEGQPEGSSLAGLPRALARFASTDASVSARWQRVEAYLRAEQRVGIAPTLGGEDLVDTGSLRQIGLGGAALAIDESQRSMRAARRTLIA